MSIESLTRQRRISHQERGRDLPITPFLPTRESWTRLSTLSTSNHTLMTTEGWEWRRIVTVPNQSHMDTGCEWYDPDITYILEAQDDISDSEEAAQQKIYDFYMKSLNSSLYQKESCGYGSAAEIAYMGYHTGCSEFKYVHERESYEVLLALLKKKKRVSLPECPFNRKKRPRLQSPQHAVPCKDDKDERPKCAKTPLGN